MKKIVGFMTLAVLLGGCAATQRPEDALSPSALIGMTNSRCESEARMVTPTSPLFTAPVPGDRDVSRDINRRTYWNCAKQFP